MSYLRDQGETGLAGWSMSRRSVIPDPVAITIRTRMSEKILNKGKRVLSLTDN
jgi:hypothetical protein